MDDNIDDIFFKGLDGKSVEKPASFWEDMQGNVLKESFVKPWWTSTSAYISSAALVVATSITVWVIYPNSNKPEEVNQQIISDTTENIKTDTIPVKIDSIIDFEEQAEIPQETNVMQEKEKLNSVSAQKETVNMPTLEVTENIDSLEEKISTNDLIQPLDSTITTVEETTNTNSDNIAIDSMEDSLKEKPTQKNTDSVIQKKKPVVVIVQDTITVTDTIRTQKKQ